MSDITHKSQKLASAVYFITGFFSDQEPLKWKLRNLSSDMVSLAMSFNSLVFKEREMGRIESREVVLEVLALIAVAKNVGLISEPNFSLLEQEFMKYLSAIGFPAGVEEKDGQAILSTKFFNPTSQNISLPQSKPETEVKDNSPEIKSDRFSPSNISPTETQPKRQLLDTSAITSRSEPKPLKEFGVVSVKKNSRQSIIISLLKRKKEIMIKDVSPLISGCSEKTIQRELLAMVAAGILKKEGEKRWSRYSLADKA